MKLDQYLGRKFTGFSGMSYGSDFGIRSVNSFKYQALKKKLLQQLSSKISANAGSNESSENFLKEVLRVSDPSSPFYNLELEDFTDSFLEDYLENANVVESELVTASQYYSFNTTEKAHESNHNRTQDANYFYEKYLNILKESYTEEQINAIERISGKSIEDIVRGEKKSYAGAVDVYQTPDFGNLVLHFDKIIDADNKYNYLKDKGVEGLPLRGQFTDEQIQLISDQYDNYETNNPQVVKDDKLEKENITLNYWEQDDFDETTLTDEAYEKYYFDRYGIIIEKDENGITAFENEEERDQYIVNKATEKAEVVNEQNNSNNEVSTDPDENKKGFWDSLENLEINFQKD